MKKYLTKSRKVVLSIYLIILILNILSWSSRAFSDWYARNILRIWVSGVSRTVSQLKFSLGEVMIAAGVVLIAAAPVTFIFLMIFAKNKRKKTAIIFSDIFMWITAFIMMMLTLNCFIMYHCTPFSEKYFNGAQREYSSQNLIDVYEMITYNLNDLSERTARDEQGYFILSDDLYENASQAMNNISGNYPQLSGYYPSPKPIYFSQFMSQQYTMGVFFPFSLETNYNNVMHEVNLPDTVCHEYAHLKGYMQEDEAGFIAYIACINSDSTDFRYSGYLSMLNYIEEAVHTMAASDEQMQRVYEIETSVCENVRKDNIFLRQEKWEEVEQSAVISTEFVDEVSDKLTDMSLKINGVEDGMQSYSRKVNLLLDYYF
ncbi:MAG: DUF3810 domain-containing protein [Oscillospiraceae bacterium]|nr:DUF3810 domain-containing protein [Oscillospiraceae bacterium]